VGEEDPVPRVKRNPISRRLLLSGCNKSTCRAKWWLKFLRGLRLGHISLAECRYHTPQLMSLTKTSCANTLVAAVKIGKYSRGQKHGNRLASVAKRSNQTSSIPCHVFRFSPFLTAGCTRTRVPGGCMKSLHTGTVPVVSMLRE